MRYCFTVFAAILLLCNLSAYAKVPEQKAQILSLNDAIARALDESPRIKSSGSALMASKGERSQAGLLPNPELSVEAENIAGRGQYKGFDSAEVTFGVSQQIEVGGKRSSRVTAASRGYDIANYEYEATRLNIIRDVTIAYHAAVAAKENVKLAEEQEKLAGEVMENVTERVNAAADPLIQKSKAAVALSTSKIAARRARSDYVIARRKLSALWGVATNSYELDSSAFFTIAKPHTKASEEPLKRNPDFMRWEAELSRSKALYSLEKANGIPNPTVSVGVRDFRENSDQAFVAGVSLPLPVLNRNQGNIAKARHEVSKTENDKRGAELALGNELTRSQQELETTYQQAISLKESILPAASNAFSLARQGYRAGKFPYLEVLDAQRTLFEARQQYHTALKDYHITLAEVERLTAKHLPDLKENEASHGN